MDRLGIQKQVLMFTAPGVQILDADTGTALARDANDQMAEAIRSYPDRFAGLTVIAPQDPQRAVRELERGMTTLGLNGAIVNSHINGEYLDERVLIGAISDVASTALSRASRRQWSQSERFLARRPATTGISCAPFALWPID
jgi:predicted TIM-barrel fold metal-dependent hydrolase